MSVYLTSSETGEGQETTNEYLHIQGGDAVGLLINTNINDYNVTHNYSFTVRSATADLSYCINNADGDEAAYFTVTVNSAPALQSLAVIPANAIGTLNTVIPYHATGTYSDGTTRDVTGTVTWQSTNTSVATITPQGVATGRGLGATNIIASQNNQAGSGALTIRAPQLVTIDLQPKTPRVTVGATAQMRVVGTYTDNSTAVITNSVPFTSQDPRIATVNSSGVVRGIAPGTTTIDAHFPTCPCDSTVVTVLAAPLPIPQGRPSNITYPVMMMIPGYMGPNESNDCVLASDRAYGTFGEIFSNHLMSSGYQGPFTPPTVPYGYKGTFISFNYHTSTACPPDSYNKDDNRKALNTSVDQLNSQIGDFMANNPAPSRLDLIGHSMGGAIALLWVNKYQLDFYQKYHLQVRVVTLDSPVVGCRGGFCLGGSGQGIADLMNSFNNDACFQETATARCNEYQARMLAARGTPSTYIYYDFFGTLHTVFYAATSKVNTRVFSAANQRDTVVIYDPSPFNPLNDSYPTDLNDTPHNGSQRYDMNWCVDPFLICHGDVLQYGPVAEWIVSALVDKPVSIPTGRGGGGGGAQVVEPTPIDTPPVTTTSIPTPIPIPPSR